MFWVKFVEIWNNTSYRDFWYSLTEIENFLDLILFQICISRSRRSVNTMYRRIGCRQNRKYQKSNSVFSICSGIEAQKLFANAPRGKSSGFLFSLIFGFCLLFFRLQVGTVVLSVSNICVFVGKSCWQQTYSQLNFIYQHRRQFFFFCILRVKNFIRFWCCCWVWYYIVESCIKLGFGVVAFLWFLLRTLAVVIIITVLWNSTWKMRYS